MYKGIDYYPEHWDLNLIDEDLKRFKTLNINLIRIGEFAWHLMEPVEGHYDFSFFDHVIEKAKANGFKVMFGTPTATFPAWLNKKYSNILIKHDQNVVYGGRREYCFNSEQYLTAVAKIVKELVCHYANEEAIVSYQIDNEVGHESSDYCVCENCLSKFRLFLKNKYQSIERLNEVYGNIFWGHTYNDFDEISLPTYTITFHNPALLLDFYRFRSESAANFINFQVELIKKYKGKHQKITHDFPGGIFSKYYDHNDVSKNLDFVSYNNYPVWGGLKEPISPSENAMQLDFIRGLLGKNFTITEQLMGAQGHQVIGYLPRPGQGYLWSMQAISHGCNNLFYFRERGMTKGQEQFCYGLIGHDNKFNRRCYEAQRFFEDIKPYENLLNTSYQAKVALIYDFDNIWSWRIQKQSELMDPTKEIHRFYQPFHDLNVNVDVIRYDRDLTNYDVIVVPIMQILDQDLYLKLEKLTKLGKTIIFGYRTGIKNKENNIHFKLTPPCLVNDMCGIDIFDVEALQEGQSVKIDNGSCTVWRDLISLRTARSLAKYQDDFFHEYSAITVNKYHDSDVYYFGGGFDNECLKSIIKIILKDKNIDFIESCKNLEIVQRADHYFMMNHNSYSISYQDLDFKPFEVKIIKKQP